MPSLTELQKQLAASSKWHFSALSALFVNCTLKRSPEPSHTQGLGDLAAGIAGGIPAYGNQRSEWDAGCHPAADTPEHR